MNILYNKHYVRIDKNNLIVAGWSDGPHPEYDSTNAICINEHGSYQFRPFSDKEVNPPLTTFDGIPLYKWDEEKIVARTDEEIVKDRENLPSPPPSKLEQLRADVDFIAIMNGVDL